MEVDYVYFNGIFFPVGRFFIKAQNRSFKYGDGIFETMRLIDDNIPFFDYHYHRLIRGMKTLKLEIPANFEKTTLKNTCLQLASKNKSECGKVRLMVFRDDGGLYKPNYNDASVFIEYTDIFEERFEMNERGLFVGTYLDIPKPVNILSPFKTNNSLPYVLAGIFAQEQQWDECLVLNTKQNVADGLYSNVFIVKNNVLLTPPVSDGGVDGVMRRVILKLAQLHRLNYKEISLTEADIENADEFFLTNAIKGIRWVQIFKKSVYKNGWARALTDLLNLATKKINDEHKAALELKIDEV